VCGDPILKNVNSNLEYAAAFTADLDDNVWDEVVF
jgi:hypothetical protein